MMMMMGAAGQAHEVRGGHLRLRAAGNRPHPTPSCARAAGPGRGFAGPAARAGRLRRRGRSAWGSRRGAGGRPDDALLVAEGAGGSAARSRARVLAGRRGAFKFSHAAAYSRGVPTADLGAARHGGIAPSRSSMPPPTASAGRCSPPPPPPPGPRVTLRRGPGGPRLPSAPPAPGHDVRFGLWAVTACRAGGPGRPGPRGARDPSPSLPKM